MKTVLLKFGLLILVLFGTQISISNAQSSKIWEWAENIVGTNKNFPYSMFTDKYGNSFIAGSFSDTLKVGKIEMVSNGANDIYLLKFDTKGSLIWAKQAGGKDYDEAYGITLDANENIYVCGYFSGTANFANIQVTSNGDRDFFVAKYSKTGEPIWVEQSGGTLEDYSNAIAVDKDGNVFITGIFKGSITLNNNQHLSKGDKDIFLIKYNNNGDILWSVTGGGTMVDEPTAVAVDEMGNCYVTGDFEGTADFSKELIVSKGAKDVFLAKYNSQGKIQFLKRGGNATNDEHASSIAVDKTGNIYLAGFFSGIANFGKTDLKSIGSDDIFVIKYNASGDEMWARQTGGKGNERARALTLDSKGNIYVTGEFNTDFTFGPNKIQNFGDWDIFVIKYSNTGEMLGGTQLAGIGYDRAYGIGLDVLSDIYLTGFFSKSITIGNTVLKSIDADDVFLAKLKAF